MSLDLFLIIYLMAGGKTSKSDIGERIDLRGDGRIVLYKREGLKNPKWQTRIRVPNATVYKTVSTKTANLVEAQTFASNLYEDLFHHVKMGDSIKSKTFASVFEEWEKSINLMSAT